MSYNVWPDHYKQLEKCSTTLQAVLWRKSLIRSLTQTKIFGEEQIKEPQELKEESKDANQPTFLKQIQVAVEEVEQATKEATQQANEEIAKSKQAFDDHTAMVSKLPREVAAGLEKVTNDFRENVAV